MSGYITNNHIQCIIPIKLNLLHTTNDECETNKYCDYYSLFIESSNVLKCEIYNKQYTFSMYISKEITIDQKIVPVFDKSYDICINIFDLNQNNITFIINTDSKIPIYNLYKLTHTFRGVNMYNTVYCSISGYINDYIQKCGNINDFLLEITID